MRTPRKIVVRAPSWVGDVVMATPALRSLRAAHPDAELVLEGRPYLAGLARGLPGVDRFAPEPRGLLARTRALRVEGFDWAVLLADSPRAALAPFAARIPVRAGYARNALRRWLLTHALPPPSEGGARVPISMIERYLRVTRALGCADRGEQLELRLDPDAEARVDQRLAAAGAPAGTALLVVTPGASFGASKLWPPESFARACDALAQRRGLLPVLAPGPGEEAVAGAVADACRSRVLQLVAPTTTLPELAALIARAALVLTNDTGPRHMAVALKRPVVTVMGPTDPRHTAHWLEHQRVLREPVECSPCHLKVCPIDHRCMTRLAPERVVAAAEELL